MKKKVWILDNESLNHEFETKIYAENDVEWLMTTDVDYQEDLESFGKFADAVVVQVGNKCDIELISMLENCKGIFSYGIGYNNIDVKYARKLGISVSNVPDYCLDEVADHTMSLILSSIRRLNFYDRDIKNKLWDPQPRKPIRRLENTTIGLLGFGNISRKVAYRLERFKASVVAHDEFVSQNIFDKYSNVERVTFDELLQKSNLLSLHVPLNDETKGLIDYENMVKMQKDAIIVNTCRGGVVDEVDLLKLIEENHISSAALDVLEEEPPSINSKLVASNNIIMTPHMAYYSEESDKELQERTAKNVLKLLDNEKVDNVVN